MEKETSRCAASLFVSRDDWTRTSGLHVPNVARYQLRYIPFPFCGGKSNNSFEYIRYLCRKILRNNHFFIMDSIRQNKVGRLIQRDLSEMFQRECKEVALGAMLSVTTVRVSPDLSYARVYVSIFPSEKTEAVLASLEEKNKQIRFILGKKIGKQTRIVPELRFFVDDSLDYIDHIDSLLKQ